MKPRYFASGTKFRRWLAAHHASRKELLVGFYRVASGRGGLTYRDALDAALAYGWIDGIRRSLGVDAYSVRFTPRARDSYWSAVNTKRFRELQKRGQIAPSGLRAFEARDEKRTREYSYEREKLMAAFDPAVEKQLRANRAAARFFDAQPPGYRRLMTLWIMSAKKDETRQKRLVVLIGRSARGLRIDPLKPRTP
ncbi:MAG TPA: YdeI/OmpD-associated family protein [Vicinamibacterales bacterium]|jgi:uncharacterized protein YdeI (YjbR/CyaY-like superfamily)